VGRGEKENKMVSNCKKLDDGSNILSSWEKSTMLLQVCECRVVQGFRNPHKTEK
jgi:hypothetical protein